MSLRSLRYALAALLLFSAAPLHADMAQAAALYKAGAAKQAAKDYRGAIADYSASLAAEPRYVFSQRERGTCKYYLGDKAGALADYSAYSQANPKDLKTAALVRRLQAAQGAAPAPAASPAAPMAAAASTGRPKWGLSLGGGFNTYAMTDFNAIFSTSSSTVSGGPISSGIGAGLGLSWRMVPKAILSLDLDYLMAGSTRKGSTFQDDYNVPALWVGPAGYYVMGFGSVDLRLGAGLGYMTLMGAGITSKSTGSVSSSATTTLSGGGFGFKFGAGLDWYVTPHVSLGLDLGYRIASVSPVTYSNAFGSGTWQKFDAATGKLSNLGLDYSGLLSRVGLSYWF